MSLSSKQRLLAAIQGGKADRLPVTTHQLMPYFLAKYMGGISNDEFFEQMGMDGIVWIVPHKPDVSKGQYYDPSQGELGFLESRRISTDSWRISHEELKHPDYKTVKFTIATPKGNLTTVLQSNEMTTWVSEHLIKEKKDIDIIAEFATAPTCDVDEVNKTAEQYGDKALIRGHIPCFDIFGQPGCWQDACCLVGTEKMIMATFDDPQWVNRLLKMLQQRKIAFMKTTKGAKYDIWELGGGDASTSVISPNMFNEYVAPYDSEIIATAHQAGQRVVYHTCGGMMPILEDIAAMGPDAMETFTPPDMGGDSDLAEAKRRIGDKVCMIGGWDQFHYFKDCTEAEARRQVRRCFEQAGQGGGYILSPSDHFFDADVELIRAFADEARKCVY
ncbi:MAG TPA: uroporphyrinogen decarboxylase family protein [Sedimentisphaerales bacterium]|nr:uroporphyrinogen decarboxylase family protein [Sedimentisphaerales bacterium]